MVMRGVDDKRGVLRCFFETITVGYEIGQFGVGDHHRITPIGNEIINRTEFVG